MVELEVLDGHVQLLEGPVREVVQLAEGHLEEDAVGGGEVPLEEADGLVVGGHLVAVDGGQLGGVGAAGAGRDLLPHGAVGDADGEAQDGEQQGRHRGNGHRRASSPFAEVEGGVGFVAVNV